MTIDITRLRELLGKLPCIPWSKARSTVSIPATEDYAGKQIPITGLDKQYARHLAAYIAAANPATMTALLSALESREAEVKRLERNRDMWKGQCERQAKQLEATRWQPIATAPRDGTEVLAWRDDCGQFIAIYTSAGALPLTQKELDKTDEATLFAEDWFTQWPHALRLEGSEAPTHWMPLPPPPAALSGPTTNEGA